MAFGTNNKTKHAFIGVVEPNSTTKCVQLGRKNGLVVHEGGNIIGKSDYYLSTIFREKEKLQIDQENGHESNNIVLETADFN